MPKTPLDLSNIISYMFLVEEPNEYVYKFKASAIRFTSEESVDWVLDGEYGGARTEVTIENLREEDSLSFFHIKCNSSVTLKKVVD